MSDDPTLDALRAAIESYVEPYLHQSLREAGALRDLSTSPEGYTAHIVLGMPVGGYQETLAAALGAHLAAAGVSASVRFTVEAQIRAHAVQRPLQPLAGIKNVVAVASGKGGVGADA